MLHVSKTPEAHPPTAETLLTIVQRRGQISLRGLCGEMWPDLPWYPHQSRDDSATKRIRANGMTAAQSVKLLMSGLAATGLVEIGVCRGEVDAMAQMTYSIGEPGEARGAVRESPHRKVYPPGSRRAPTR